MDALTKNLQKNYPLSPSLLYQSEEIVEMFLKKARENSQFIIREYIDHLNLFASNRSYSDNELYLEFLSLGVYGKVYSTNARTCRPIWMKVSLILNNWQNKVPGLKKLINILKGIAFMKMSSGHEKKTLNFNKLKSFNLLIYWMEASGEFAEEVKKFKQWYQYLQTISPDRANSIINRSIEQAEYFENICKSYGGLSPFRIDEILRMVNNRYSPKETRNFKISFQNQANF
jgi:hypothetical protein